MDSDLTRLGGLWAKESPKAGRFLSGSLDVEAFTKAIREAGDDGLTLFVFAVKDRKSDCSPTHSLVVGPAKKKPKEDPSYDEIPF